MEGDATIVSMIAGGFSYAKIEWAMGKGPKTKDITNLWHREFKESSGIINSTVKTGRHSIIAWTAEDDETIMSMIAGGSSYAEIASALGHNYDDIKNRRRRGLKHYRLNNL